MNDKRKMVRLICEKGLRVQQSPPPLEGQVDENDALFLKFSELFKHLGGNPDQVDEVYVIDNPRQRSSFQEFRRNITSKHRDNESLFRKEDWRNGNEAADVEVRRRYLRNLSEKVRKFRTPFNDGSKVSICLVCLFVFCFCFFVLLILLLLSHF